MAPRVNLVYPKREQNTIKRYSHQGTYDLPTIHALVQSASILHVSFVAATDVGPTILPMLGVLASYADPSSDPLTSPSSLYLHSYTTARLATLSRDPSGLPVSVAATHVDGLVLSLTPMSHSFNYRSAVIFGKSHFVTDEEEKLYAMEQLVEKVMPGRWEGTRTPPDRAEMQSTAVLRVDIDGASGKGRTGGPKDDKKDTKTEELVHRVWTGVVPLHTQVGEPLQSGDGKVEEPPAYVREWINETNKDAAAYAVESANGEEKKMKEVESD
ncbi:MAG: hypothetical protein M1814_004748 [Vezdaea aestivalis]|nr:MAG: hypothetical protein M1814_004748 [Vezdaea aestivalis]